MADPIQQLLSRVAALEQRLTQQLRGSIGVSTGNAGALNIRTTQLGFRGETTSTFDSTDGYSWKRSRLEPPAYVNPGVQLTGDKAFTPWNDEDFPVGTVGWFEPSLDGVGYIFSVSTPDTIMRGVLRGVTAGAVSTGNYGTVNLVGGGTQSAYNPYTPTIGSGKTVHIAYVANTAQYEFIQQDC